MIIINLTPHAVRILGADGKAELATIAPSGVVARVAVSRQSIAPVDGIPVSVCAYGAVENLPAEEVGTILVVSGMVRAAATGRRDVFSPGELVRDAAGQPVGCRGLEANDCRSALAKEAK